MCPDAKADLSAASQSRVVDIADGERRSTHIERGWERKFGHTVTPAPRPAPSRLPSPFSATDGVLNDESLALMKLFHRLSGLIGPIQATTGIVCMIIICTTANQLSEKRPHLHEK